MIKLISNQRGSATVLLVAALTGLLSFAAIVIDGGLLYVNRVELVNMADAAALAGLQDLPGDRVQAEISSRDYAAQNGHIDDQVTVVVPSNKTVAITVTRQVEFIFARIFGMDTANVRAQAAAILQPASGVIGVVPFGVVKQDFVYGQTYDLKVGAGDGYAGNYDALALGGTGSRTYTDNIKYGYEEKLSVGQLVSTETGNMSGGTSDGVNYRINADPGTTYSTVEQGSSRVIVVPLIETITNDTGRHDVKIVGFAGFFLESVSGSGTLNNVSGKFMRLVLAGDTSGTAPDYGVYSGALVPYESVAANSSTP